MLVRERGRVHIASLGDEVVENHKTVVKAGEIVKVKVMEVDLQRKRIALSMRLDEQPGEGSPRRGGNTTPTKDNATRAPANKAKPRGGNTPAGNSAMGDALAAAFGKKG